jgi:hypothetical protein
MDSLPLEHILKVFETAFTAVFSTRLRETVLGLLLPPAPLLLSYVARGQPSLIACLVMLSIWLYYLYDIATSPKLRGQPLARKAVGLLSANFFVSAFALGLLHNSGLAFAMVGLLGHLVLSPLVHFLYGMLSR